MGFEFVAIQLVNKEDRTIQTVYATASQKGLIGLAKHPIDGDDEILDIQASVFNAQPPKIKLISRWEMHFDKLLYDQFKHAYCVRVWVPIIVLKRGDGSIISDWSHGCKDDDGAQLTPWRNVTEHKKDSEVVDGHVIPRYNIDIALDKLLLDKCYGDVYIERLGTVEAGHHRLVDGMTCEMGWSSR